MYIFKQLFFIKFLLLFFLITKNSLAVTYNELLLEDENIYKGSITYNIDSTSGTFFPLSPFISAIGASAKLNTKVDPNNIFSYMPNGYGEMFYQDKSIYKGRWDNGLRNNRGLMIYSDKSQYDGIWVFGKRIGRATYTLKDGTKFTGEFNYGYFGWGMYKISKINDIWYSLLFWYYNYFKNQNLNIEREDNIYFDLISNKKLISSYFDE